MAIALTTFEGLCGFKPLDEIATILHEFPEFEVLIGKDHIQSFTADSKSAEYSSRQNGLKSLFSQIVRAPQEAVTIAVEKAVARLAGSSYKQGSPQELFLRLDSQFPGGDIGTFCALMLNYMRLEPGQAFFMPANDPHAYLSGGS